MAVPVNDALERDRSGPAVARLYHRLLATIFLIAWASLGVQGRVARIQPEEGGELRDAEALQAGGVQERRRRQ